MLERLSPHGVRLSLFTAMMDGLDTVMRPPRTTTVFRFDGPPGWWVAAEHADV